MPILPRNCIPQRVIGIIKKILGKTIISPCLAVLNDGRLHYPWPIKPVTLCLPEAEVISRNCSDYICLIRARRPPLSKSYAFQHCQQGIQSGSPQYNNSGKYTTYMHITIGHNLLPLFAFFSSLRGVHGSKKNWWIFIFMAKKLSLLPSVHPMRMRRAGKRNFTQVSPWAN